MIAQPTTRVDLRPERMLNELPLYDEVGWQPHDGQRQIICDLCRNRVVSAGRRFGKSEIGGHKLVQEAFNTRLAKAKLEDLGKRREFWIVGPSYADSEKEFRVLWNRLEKVGLKPYFDKPGSYNNPQVGSMELSLWGGKFIVMAKSEKNPDSLVGEGLSGIILAEAAKMKHRTWNKLLRPTLADFAGWSLMTSTPEGKNWFYELWQRGQDPTRPDWGSHRMPSWMNPYVYPAGATDDAIIDLRRAMDEKGADGRRQVIDLDLFRRLGVDPEIGELAADLTEEAFNQEIAADFTEFVGRVFKGFDEDEHVGDYDYDPSLPLYACADAGFTNPSVWLLVQPSRFGEQLRVLDEVYEAGHTAEEFADLVKDRGCAPQSIRMLYPDPADPAFATTMAKNLGVAIGGGTGGERRLRIDAIRAGLKDHNPHLADGHPDRFPKLVFDRKCKRTIADMLNYKYPEKRGQVEGNASEEPMKKDDHGPEALGRFYAGHYRDTTAKRRGRSRKSNMAA